MRHKNTRESGPNVSQRQLRVGELVRLCGHCEDMAAAYLAAAVIVAGAYGHSRFREWVLGGVTDAILNSGLTYDQMQEEKQYYPLPCPEPYIGRRRTVGWGLYGALGTLLALQAREKTGKGQGVSKSQMLLNVYKKWGVEFTDDNAADSYSLAKLVSGKFALAYEKEGDFKQALQYFKQFNTLENRLASDP